MNVFELRNRVVADYASYVRSFLRIKDDRIRAYVEESLRSGVLWPDPLIQLNPAFEPGAWIDDLVTQGVLHPEAGNVFRNRKEPGSTGERMRLHRHQLEAVPIAAPLPDPRS